MSFKMMDVALAESVMASIEIGNTVSVFIDGIVTDRKVIDKTLYGFTVQGNTNRLYLPVEFTTAYREAIKMRMPANETTAAPARRGRPKKDAGASGPAAPVEHPQQPATRPAWAPPVEAAAKPAAIAAPASNDLEYGNIEWFTEQLDAALAQLRQDALTMANALIEDANANASEYAVSPPQAAKPTCMDCRHSNLTDGSCNRFRMIPPMKVIADAKSQCDAFSSDSLDNDIPY